MAKIKIKKQDLFKYNESLEPIEFNSRRFLMEIQDYKFKELCKKYQIPSNYVKYSKISELLQKEGINKDIIELVDALYYEKLTDKERAVLTAA
jgi:hypothetical protein